MSRIRSIKPTFFTNEGLGELAPLTRLLFIGLWTLADREGRLEDRPRRIKAELFPYEEGFDVDAALDELAARGFVLRYEVVAAGRLIQVVNFGKHQRPHAREAPSELPGPRAVKHDQGGDGASPGETQSIMAFDLGGPAVRLVDDLGGQEGDPFANQGEQADQPLHHGNGSWNGILDPDPEVEVGEERRPATPPPAVAVERLAGAWQRAAGAPCTPMVHDMFLDELRLGTPAEWVEDAIVEAGANGAVRWRYVERVLERFKRSRRFPGESDHEFTLRTLRGPHYGPSEAAS